MRLMGYIRVSTDEQASHGHSIEMQDQQINKYCDLYGHDLLDVIVDEAVSGGMRLDKRPGGHQLMEALRDNQADGAVFVTLDRMFRLLDDGLETAKWFDKRAKQLHSVTEHIDTSDPDGWWFMVLKMSAAERERRVISMRNTRTTQSLKANGKKYGHVPFGCIADDDNNLLKDPDTWPVRELIVQMRSGTGQDKGLSLRAISTELQQRGIPAPGRTLKGRSKGGKLWHLSTLKGILDKHEDLQHIPDAPQGGNNND